MLDDVNYLLEPIIATLTIYVLRGASPTEVAGGYQIGTVSTIALFDTLVKDEVLKLSPVGGSYFSK